MNFSVILALLGANAALAHMQMSDPPPLRSPDNPNAGSDVNFELKSPIQAAQFPCGNSLDLLGTEQGAPVAEYQAGQSYQATIEGGAAHEGGSCQFSLSYDEGATFQVIQSIVGDCPVSGGSSFDFTIPADAPSSDAAVFSWSWINKIGNREFYQNCAVVSISGGSDNARRQNSVAFKDRPEMFVANIVDGCSTAEGTDVLFPDPGPDVTMNTEGTAPEGSNCGAAVGGGGGSGGGSGGGAGGDTGAGGGAGGDTGSGGGAGGDTGAGGGDDGQYHPPEGGEGGAGGDAGSGNGGGAPAQSSAPGGAAPSESGSPEEPARSDPAGAEPSQSAPASGGDGAAPTSGSDAPQPSMLVPTQTPSSLFTSESSHSYSTGGIFVTAPTGGVPAPTGTAPAGGDTPTTLQTSAAAPV